MVIHHSGDVPIHPLLPLIFFHLEPRYEGEGLDSAMQASTESFHTNQPPPDPPVQGVLEGQRSSFNRNGIVVLCLAAGVMSGTFFFFSRGAFFFFFFNGKSILTAGAAPEHKRCEKATLAEGPLTWGC